MTLLTNLRSLTPANVHNRLEHLNAPVEAVLEVEAVACRLVSYLSIMSYSMRPKYPLGKLAVHQGGDLSQPAFDETLSQLALE
jgi:hypothetical protein